MANYREILRLHSLGINKTEIAASLHCARNTVAATLQRADNCVLQWPLPDECQTGSWQKGFFPALRVNLRTRWLLYPLKERETRDLLEIMEARYKRASTTLCSQFDIPGWREALRSNPGRCDL